MPKSWKSPRGLISSHGKIMQVRLLLSRQRSGSHFVKSYIETRFAGITCSGEVLEKPLDAQAPVLPAHPEIPRFWTWYAREAIAGGISTAPDERISAFEFYLNNLAWKSKPNELVFDVKYNCAHSLSGYEDTDHGSTDFTAFIKSRNIPVLHLMRGNILKTLVSHQLAHRTGIWHRASERSASEVLPKIELNAQETLRAIAQSDRLTQDYRHHFRGYPGYEEVVYEDLVREQKDASVTPCLDAVARFLGRDPVASALSEIWCKKTTPDDPAEVVENWDEIVRVLRGTKYAWMTQGDLLAAA
jgi:LPS sulfotransferase NodH